MIFPLSLTYPSPSPPRPTHTQTVPSPASYRSSHHEGRVRRRIRWRSSAPGRDVLMGRCWAGDAEVSWLGSRKWIFFSVSFRFEKRKECGSVVFSKFYYYYFSFPFVISVITPPIFFFSSKENEKCCVIFSSCVRVYNFFFFFFKISRLILCYIVFLRFVSPGNLSFNVLLKMPKASCSCCFRLSFSSTFAGLRISNPSYLWWVRGFVPL